MLTILSCFKSEVREDVEQASSTMEACIRDIDAWMTVNKLKMNRDKTELLVLKAHHHLLPPLKSVAVSDELIRPWSVAKNIGVLFDTNMSTEHVIAVSKSAFYHLRNISRIRKYISSQTAEILMHALVTSRLDFCNSLLYTLQQEW